ncbi:MAG: magnesium transporter [Thioalkalivibrionaceae bacterium]
MNDAIFHQNYEPFLSNGDYASVAKLLFHPVPAITANRLSTLGPKERLRVFKLLAELDQRVVFMRMDEEEQALLLEAMEPTEATTFANHLPAYTLSRCLPLLPRPLSAQILAGLSKEKIERVRALWKFDDDAIARLMRESLYRIDAEQTVGEVLQTIRTDASIPDDLTEVLLVTRNDQHRGMARLVKLLRADPNDAVSQYVELEDFKVSPDTDKVEAARLLQRTNLPVLPVVDAHGRLLGIVRADDAMDVLDEDASEDVYKKAGIGDITHVREVVRSEKLTSGGIGYSVKVRLAFLLVTLAGGLAVGGLIDTFEETLAAIVALAIFIPLIMDMGGNVGTQSTTIFARGFALGHIRFEHFFRRHLMREGLVGVTMGAIIALIAGTIAHFWQGAPNGLDQLGFVVGISLFTSVTLASILGFLLPYVMIKIGVDHAPGADPFITTIKDFTGLAVYFLLASALLSV